MIIVIITGIIDVYMGYLIIVRKRNADKRGFLLSILEDWKYDDVNEKENVKTVNLNIVCKVKGK